MAMNNKPEQNNSKREFTPAQGWLNITLEDLNGNVIGKVGGIALVDDNALHAAINAAEGEFDPDQCKLVIAWNSGTPKRSADDFKSLFKRK